MAAFLEKSTGSEGFHQVIDFLSQSHISYALTKKPEIYISFIKQFWRTAEASTDTDGEVTITAIIDGQSKTITEASLRRHLKLEDHDGITSIPNSEIFEQLTLMGYQTDSDKLTFQKGVFSPQWRFIQICLDMQKKQLKTHSSTYPVPSLNNKVLAHEEASKDIQGITSSPSLSSKPSLNLPLNLILHPVVEFQFHHPLESTLMCSLSWSDEAFSQELEVGRSKVKTGKARKRARVVLSKDEEYDSSKHGRIDKDPNTYFLKMIIQKLMDKRDWGLEKAIRLQEQVDEEERAQIVRDEEIA
ncbi:hypothetical protein Tco_0428374 [Tanacetum coccineum]